MSAQWRAEHAWWRQPTRAAGLACALACALACLVPYATSNAVSEVNCKKHFENKKAECPYQNCPNWRDRGGFDQAVDDFFGRYTPELQDFFGSHNCEECGKGKYGSDGSCHDCPFFTRRRKYRDESNIGTLWCTNSCKEMYENKQIVTDVEFKETGNAGLQLSVLKKIKFQYPTEIYVDGLMSFRMDEITQVVCDKCPQPTFRQEIAADMATDPNLLFFLDIKANGFSDAEVNSVSNVAGSRRLIWTFCRACPRGFVYGRWTIPDDVVVDTRTRTNDKKWTPDPQNTEYMIPCRACPSSDGVPQESVCTKCKLGEYQLLEQVQFIKHTHAPEWSPAMRQLTTIWTGVECRACPEGHEIISFQCRGVETECCQACDINKYKPAATGIQCTDAQGQNVVTKSKDGEKFYVQSGGTKAEPCGKGEQFKNLDGWKTCLPCSLDNTYRAKALSGCEPCNHEIEEHLAATDNNGESCKGCTLCQELDVQSLSIDLKAESLKLSQFEQLSETVMVMVTQKIATCKPLKNPNLKLENGAWLIEGEAHWRRKGKATGEILPDFYYLQKNNNTCEKKHCASLCKNAFQYADNCGNQVLGKDKWLEKTSDPLVQVQVKNLDTSERATDWHVLTQGMCLFCTPCDAGSYNEDCNKDYEGGQPEGKCQECKKECLDLNGIHRFMLHSDGEAGCHKPAANKKSSKENNKFETLTDYTCEQCPTWVSDPSTGKLSVVTACGSKKTKYLHYGEVKKGILTSVSKDVPPISPAGQTIQDLPRENFRGFMTDLVEYCPSGYFFDKTSQDCTFVTATPGKKLRIQQTDVLVGYDEYMPKCCKACTSCSGATQKRDMDSWKECTGATLDDTQNRCVDKCVLGFWEAKNGTEAVCRRCSTCFAGVI